MPKLIGKLAEIRIIQSKRDVAVSALDDGDSD
jgi:hypothetical protein